MKLPFRGTSQILQSSIPPISGKKMLTWKCFQTLCWQKNLPGHVCLLSPLPFYSELSLSPRSPSFDPGIAASRDSEEKAKIRCMGGV